MYELGNQIVVDSVILDGECEVDESFITGEFNYITKKEGDTLLSGSFIVSGNVTCKVLNVGTDNYMALISKDAKKIKQKQTEIMGSLKKIVKYVSFALIPVGILLFYNQFNMDGSTFKGATESTVAALVAMIPEGLMLLVSTVLAISVVKLSKYKSPTIILGNIKPSALSKLLKSKSPPISCGNIKSSTLINPLKSKSPRIFLGNSKPSALSKLLKSKSP